MHASVPVLRLVPCFIWNPDEFSRFWLFESFIKFVIDSMLIKTVSCAHKFGTKSEMPPPYGRIIWSPDEVSVLINHVEHQPSVWKTDFLLYKDSSVRKNVWEQIGQALDKPAESCKKKWTSEREAFSRKLKKVRNAPPESKEAKEAAVAKWEYWEQMQFMKDYVQNAITVNGLPGSEEAKSESETETAVDGLNAASAPLNATSHVYQPKVNSITKRKQEFDLNELMDFKALKTEPRFLPSPAPKIFQSLQVASPSKPLSREEDFGQFVVLHLMQTPEAQRDRFMLFLRKKILEFSLKLMNEVDGDTS